MVEAKDKENVPATPQITNGVTFNWADEVETVETVGNKVSGKAEGNQVPVLKLSELGVKIEYNSDGDKVEIEYRINTDTNKKEKVVTTYKQQKQLVQKSVAARRRLAKFGASANDEAGPSKATTQISHEEIRMDFVSAKDTTQLGDEEELKKLQIGDKMIVCRHCGATTHLSAQCPLKDQMQGYKNLTQDGKDIGGFEPVAPGSYVPPSMRNRPGGAGASAAGRNDENCIKVSNIPEFVDDNQLKDLFKSKGAIERVFLAKDKFTKQSKGFAFITYRDRSSAEAAIEQFNRHRLGCLILSVEWAEKQR